MINQGQIIGQGPGSAYAFGSFINPNVPQAQTPAQPTVEPIGAPQGIPGINEYYQSISNLKSMVAEAKEKHGIDITKPDYTDPERMALYNMYLQAQGKAAAMGAKLAKGAALEKSLGERIAKGETVVGGNFSFNAPLTEAYIMQNSRFAGMPNEVAKLNEGLSRPAQTVSAYRSAMRDWSAAKSIFEGRLKAAKEAGQWQLAKQAEEDLKMLVKPRLENISERQIGLEERKYNSETRSVKLKEDKLNADANTVNFALNQLERPFKTDEKGNIIIGKDGRPATTQALKDITGMVVGAPLPEVPNSEILGTNVFIEKSTGRPIMQFRYAEFEQEDETTRIGSGKDSYGNIVKTKGRKRIGGDKYRTKYLDGDSFSSVQKQILDMINYNRAKVGEKQIGYDSMATEASLNPTNRRNESFITDFGSIIDMATRSGKPITMFRGDVENIVARMPAYQEMEKQYFEAKTEEEAQEALEIMQIMKREKMSELMNMYAGQGPKVVGYTEKTKNSRQSPVPGVALPK